MLVYGDTNSTLGGARAAVEAGVPLAHVEAGLRSYDDSMPEEHNRVETDRLSQLLFAPDDRSREILDGEEVPGRVEVVGDVMLDANQRLLPIAWERSEILERRGLEPGGYVVATLHREANVVQPRLGRILEGLGGWKSRSFSRHILGPARLSRDRPRRGLSQREAHRAARLPRLRRPRLAGARDRHRLRRACRRRPTGTASLASPPRPSTEWVDTVEAGANVLVDDDPDRLVEAVRTAEMPASGRALRRRPCVRPDRGRSVPFPAE